MGFFDYVSDLYSALTIEPVYAEAEAGGSGSTRSDSEDQKFASGDFNSGKDQRGGQSGGLGQAEQTRGATVKGGASTGSPASYEQESGDEAEANKADAKKDTGEQDGGAAGHRPGSGGEASGQVGPESAGPHGGAVGTKANEDEDEDEEEEEDEDEPKDLKPIIEEECMKSQECAPLKHHYDHCAERVTSQQDQHGKAHEDCVEEYFHLMHCASQCAAPKLFKQLR